MLTGVLVAFVFYIILTGGIIVWLLERGRRAVEELDKEIEELRRQPP